MEPTSGTTAAPVASASFELRLRARLLAALFGAGATLVLLTLALPHAPGAAAPGLLLVAGIAYAVGGLVFWQADSVPAWALPLALAAGTTLIAGAAHFAAERPGPLVFLLLWIFLYAAYFLAYRQAAAQIVYVGIVYAALLVAHPPESSAVAWWLVGMGTAIVAALVIRVMRVRLEQLIARLYDAARTDPLTRLPNRRGFRELLDLEVERARRSATPMTVIVGDVDHFKAVNDRSGHHVGDAVLQRVGELLDRSKRQIDAAARVGGEEFALVLPDTDAPGALVVAERLRGAVRDAFATDAVPITISFGIASFPSHGETAASLLHAADEALYSAKESGRNRTVIHSPALRGAVQERRDAHDVESERFLALVLETAESFDVRFSGSARHSETVGRYAEMMARGLGLSERRVGRVRLAGLLHDVGKIGVDKAILLNPGRLTEEELAEIRRHPQIGARMLDHPSLVDVKTWVETHHERPDGHGYPHGLCGAALPLEARILAVADAYEAMTSDRVYRASIGHAAARAELERCAGSQFDAHVVQTFLAILAHQSQHAEPLLASL
jgi:two-component system cell cycle response regulator